MKYSQYLNIKKELYNNLLDYIDNETEADSITFYHYLDNINNRQEMILFFGLLVQICSNHHRKLNFNKKIEKIIQYFMTNLKQAFSNLELFEIFKTSKLLVLILVVNETITVLIYYTNYQTNTKYHQFFYPEIKNILEVKKSKN